MGKKLARFFLNVVAASYLIIIMFLFVGAIKRFGWFWGVIICIGILVLISLQDLVTIFWRVHMQHTLNQVASEQINEGDFTRN